MTITDFAVKRYQFTVVLFLMLGALGVASWMRIPRYEDPVIPIPQYNIAAVYPGATAADMEQLVVDKIEARLRSLERMKKIVSHTEDGLAVISAEFEPDVDADKKETDVLREVNRTPVGSLAELRAALRKSAPKDLLVLVQRGENTAFHVLKRD